MSESHVISIRTYLPRIKAVVNAWFGVAFLFFALSHPPVLLSPNAKQLRLTESILQDQRRETAISEYLYKALGKREYTQRIGLIASFIAGCRVCCTSGEYFSRITNIHFTLFTFRIGPNHIIEKRQACCFFFKQIIEI